jgi:two-component sensor histidine kinase
VTVSQSGLPAIEQIRLVLCAAVVVLGLSVLGGWIYKIEVFKSVVPGLSTMKVNAAIGFILAGAGIGAAPYRRLRVPACFAALLLLAIGAITLAEYALQLPINIDQLFIRDTGTLRGSGQPGRMSFLTATAYVTLAPAILLLVLGNSRAPILVAHALSGVSAFVSILAASGYALGAEAYGWLGFYTFIAVHSAVGLMVASIAVLMTRAQEGWFQAYADSPAAREVLVRLVPLAFVVPVATGLLVLLGAGVGAYNAAYALTLFIPIVAVSLMVVSFWVAARLRDSESVRQTHERHLELLVAELNHRVKNTLAIVQSFAHQSFRSAKSSEDGVKGFEGRLIALARAHNLLTRQNWDSIGMDELVRTCLAGTEEPERFDIKGDDVPVTPKTAVTMAMTLHELATNSIKYGALSNRRGKVVIRWGKRNDRFHFCWADEDGPAVVPPDRRGFGTRMLERALASELRGKAAIDYSPTGLVYKVEGPARDEL